MVKRKRAEESLDERLERHKTDLFRALKKVKGFERQRLSKRVRDKDNTPERKQQFELEVAVLKSLDLHQTAYHYLYTSLLKVKALANHPGLPEDVRKEIPKPDLEERERSALHAVTSCLFNRLEVRQVIEGVIADVCAFLHLAPPEKKKGKKKGGKDKDEEAGSEAEERGRKKGAVDGAEAEKAAKKERKERKENAKMADEKPKKARTSRKEETEEDDEGSAGSEAEDTDAEERAFAKYEALLAGSSEESDADSESESDHIQKGGRKSIRVRDMSISLSPEPASGRALARRASPSSLASGSDSEPGSEPGSASEADFQSESESESEPEERPPKQAKLSKSSKSAKTKSKSKPSDIFLPSLMGGYVSGSESSASEVDVAPRKNRLGQKQRQAIWEKKFGQAAKHMQELPAKRGKGKGGARDDGWDMRRGAVGADDGKGRKPWKKGIEGPLAAMGSGGNAAPVTKKDDEGPLHPSWEARKKAKDQQPAQRISMRPSAANKIVFDD